MGNNSHLLALIKHNNQLVEGMATLHPSNHKQITATLPPPLLPLLPQQEAMAAVALMAGTILHMSLIILGWVGLNLLEGMGEEVVLGLGITAMVVEGVAVEVQDLDLHQYG
jgi:hypothetical protein